MFDVKLSPVSIAKSVGVIVISPQGKWKVLVVSHHHSNRPKVSCLNSVVAVTESRHCLKWSNPMLLHNCMKSSLRRIASPK